MSRREQNVQRVEAVLMLALGFAAWCFTVNSTAMAAADLTIGAAASLQDVVEEIAQAFVAQAPEPKPHLAFSFAASSELVKQALHHAPLDVVLSADSANMDKLEAAHPLLPGSRAALVENQVVLITTSGAAQSVAKLEDLQAPQIKRIALCDRAVPIGQYGYSWLSNHHLDKILAPKLVQAANVRAALALVARGGADAGFVYATDVPSASSSGASPIAVRLTAGTEEGLRVVYPGAVLKATRLPQEAKAFMAFLRSPPAQAAFKAHGFIPVVP